MQQGKGRRRRVKGLAGQVQHDRRILADGIEHHRVAEFGHHFAHDMDAFGFKLLQVGQIARYHMFLSGRGAQMRVLRTQVPMHCRQNHETRDLEQPGFLRVRDRGLSDL